MSYNQPAISRLGVSFEQEHALLDVRDVILERGKSIKIVLLGEDKVERDAYGNIKRRIPASETIFNFYAFPIMYNPTEEQAEKAGLKEKTDLILYTAMQDWIDNDMTLERLESIDLTRAYVVVNSQKYEIKDKTKHDQIADNYLYIVLGLNRI